jgi:DNA phosphorothioation-associated putative methyltransferase
MRTLIEKGIINKDSWILDYGCGRGDDVNHLREQGYGLSRGYEPNMPCPDIFIDKEEEYLPKFKFNIVTLIYVLNVVEGIEKRKEILRRAFYLSDKHILIAVRTEKINGMTYKDGVMTKRKTFQKRYTTEELLAFIQSALGDLAKHKLIQKVIKPGMVLLTKEQI